MTDFPYREVAAKMAEQTPWPSDDQTIPDHYTSRLIYAVIDAMEALADD